MRTFAWIYNFIDITIYQAYSVLHDRIDYISCQYYIWYRNKLEIDDGKELTEGFLQEELHPKVNLHRPKFAKPKGPPNRGAKRITKVQELGTLDQDT
ncbi:twinfilin isoform X1 [Vespula squamosa]|uniref:Twinfilin isoform X1 n=1 Tax=Vespula squamosa TaxID=30214 RepID=A0ABD2A9B8_VESSQ